MLGWISKELLLAISVSLAIALVAVSLGGTPSQYEYPPRQQGCDNPKSYQQASDPHFVFQIECSPNCTIKRADGVRNDNSFTGLLNELFDDPVIGLTGGILVANFLLVFAVLRQIKESRESNEARLRAYVVAMVGTQFRQGAVRGLRFEFRPGMLNTGQTPAYEVRTVAKIAFMTPVEAATFDFNVADPAARGASAVTLGPRQDRFVQAIFDRRLTKAELREFQRYQKNLFVYGTTWYRDAFDYPRYTNFCFSISWWNKRGPPMWITVFRHSDSN